MTRVKFGLLAALTVLVVMGVAVSSASAAACKEEAGKGKFVLCLGEPLSLTEGTFTIHAETDTVYRLHWANSGLEVLCKAVSGLGALTSAAGVVSILNLVLSFTVCPLPGIETKCEVVEPILTEKLKGVIEEKVKNHILFTPEIGSVFAQFTIKAKAGQTCLEAGVVKVTLLPGGKGGVLCESELQKTLSVHLLECTAAHSDLEAFGEAATFEGNFNSRLLSHTGVEEKWAVIEGT